MPEIPGQLPLFSSRGAVLLPAVPDDLGDRAALGAYRTRQLSMEDVLQELMTTPHQLWLIGPEWDVEPFDGLRESPTL